MSEPELTALTPLWWLMRLEDRLAQRQAEMAMFERFYVGDHPFPFVTPAHQEKLRDEFSRMLDESRTNYCRLVVDAVEERLRVEGIRLSASTDQQTDQASWDIWQANQMDAEAPVAFVDSLVKGVSYLSVWAGEKPDDYPLIAVEDPTQTIVGYEPGSGYRKRAAALKLWTDDWSGVERANVYLPKAIHKFRRVADTDEGIRVGTPAALRATGEQRRAPWLPLEQAAIVRNRVGVVPIVPLRNRGRVTVEGESELADVYRVQNQINGFLFLLALAGYFGAHRQRWMTGVTLNKDESGNAIEPFRTAIDRLWFSEDKDANFGDFEQTDLSGYISAIEQKVQSIAVTTRTPRHYFLPSGQEPSGDAIKSAESGLVKKVKRKMGPFGECLEEVLRLARKFQGEKDVLVDSEIVWADPSIRTEAEITDAAVKKLQLGLITREQALEDCGYSQVQIARMMAAPAPEPVVDPAPPAEVQTV